MLTHKISHTLEVSHSTSNDSVMFTYIPENENQFIVKLSIEDILTVQNLYESKDGTNVPKTIYITTTTIALTIRTTTTRAK